ncbi:MAG: hypothetical protein E7091_10500 [Bacteroidales bacterium]|nr:hypothetical protein [Bacteroidales bacterium]
MQQLSLFRGVHDTQPRPVTLEELVTMMRTDQSVRDLTEKHRYARSVGDEQGASRYKKMMTSFGVAARFEGGRQQKHIVELTGLSLVDIDHIPAERMSEVLALVRGDEHTLLAYTTLSGQGVRILFRYQINENVNENLRAPLGTPPSQSDTPSINRGGVSSASTHPEGMQFANCPSVYRGTSGTQCSGGSSKHSAEQYKQVFEQGNKYYSTLTGLPTDGQCKNVGRISTIAYDEELYYNPEATPFVIKPEEKKPVGRPKRVESGKMTVESCEAAVLHDLERRGVVYEAGTYNKYVSAACYEMNRYGVPEEQCREWAVNRFADYDAAEVASIVRSCYLQTEEHGTARPPKAEKESRYASIKDIQDWLTENNIRIRHNLITRKREIQVESGKMTDDSCCRPDGNFPLLSFNSQLIELTDQHVNSLYCRFCLDTGRQAKISDFYIIIESDFYPDYHPLKEYLESLPAWDGMTDHIDRLALTELALIDLEELDNMRPEAVNLLKAITTDPAINLRPVWERYALRRQHIASFCGTGNNPRFLTDLSGNRRWLPFMVESIDSPWERTTDYDGIYAQAYALWQQGFRYWFDDAENAELEQHNRQFEEPNIEEELILTYLRKPYGDEAGEFLTATRIIELIGMYVKCPLSPKRVAFAMRRLGFEQRRTKSARGWNVVILTGDDIKNVQRQNARLSDVQ